MAVVLSVTDLSFLYMAKGLSLSKEVLDLETLTALQRYIVHSLVNKSFDVMSSR
jgi:predicted RNA-binding protein Jag